MNSFLKWAGGKSRLMPFLKENFANYPFERFVDVFGGSGTVSLNMDCDNIWINDLNKDLYSIYVNLTPDFVSDCRKMFISKNNTQERYNFFREKFNSSLDPYERAVLFVYLNRHGYNGLCRYNSSGKFNVPFGKYEKPYFPEKEFENAVPKFSKYKKICLDFIDVIPQTFKGDLVYCDPPYIPLNSSFNYTKNGFGPEGQLALAEFAASAASRGAVVIISNHNCPEARKIYKKAEIKTIDVSRVIGCKNRGYVQEIIAIYGEER